jgi:chromosome segregation ATPase
MAIPSVMQGLIETESGKVFELDSPKGAVWLETIGSFRFEPSGDSKPYTVRKEASGYWYGCRKVAGKVRKKYIGKSSEISIPKLEEIAKALEVPPVARVNQVAEVAQEVAEGTQVVEKVAEVAQDRLTALELEVANLRKALEALQEALPGKLNSGDSTELPKVSSKVDSKVVEELQNNLGNLKAENETLKADYAQLLESSTVVANKLREEVQRLRSQLETERADREEVEAELSELKQKSAISSKELEDIDLLKERNHQLRLKIEAEREESTEKILRLESQLASAQTGNEKSAAASELPEAADLLNQLKGRRKKSRADLADIDALQGLLAAENGSNSV